MHRFILLIVVSLLALSTTQFSRAEQVQLTPSKDNTLYEDSEGDLSNGAGKGLFIGKTGSNDGFKTRRAALAFDLSSIPVNAVIDSATVTFTINKAPPDASFGTAYLHRFEQNWGESASLAPGLGGSGGAALPSDASWIYRFYDTHPWTTQGGDYVSTPSASANLGTSGFEELNFSSTPQLVADIQAWLVDPSTNFGWVLIGIENIEQNARRLASREELDGTAPKLTINYTVPSVVEQLTLNLQTDELDDPVSMAHASDGSHRPFVVEQGGVIRIFDLDTETLLPTPFLDISADVYSAGNEQGLLGLAFHPDYETNGKFYVNYIISPAVSEWHTVVAEFQVSPNPDIAQTGGKTILQFQQNATNHNGGDIHFGPDGYLYIASGDGGGREDQYANGQNINTLLGTMLRIDVDGAAQPGAEICGLVADYGIPAGNAFPGSSDGCDEILHFGLRNPWRFSFDALTSDLWIADVGQYAWEEVNHSSPGTSGVNFGWSCREGLHDFPDGHDCISTYTDPVIEYAHSSGNCSITGGYVYRGSNLTLNGRYLYGDWCTATVWVARYSQGSWVSEQWPLAKATLQSLASFGQDENCNLYLVDRDAETGNEANHGALYRIGDTELVFQSGFENRKCP